MSLRTRLIGAFTLLVLIVAVGTTAYMWVENLDFLDAFYLTVITISTVGFSEPGGGFSQSGELVTVALIIVGVGTVFYTAAAALEFGMEEFLGGTMQARREKRRIARMSGHVIICGYGRVGRQVHELIADGPRGLVVVDDDERHAQAARDAGVEVVIGDATDDRILDDAGIDRAEILIASVRTDPDNVAIVLSARARRPNLRIIARANETQTERKLLLAGADRVVTPVLVGAERIASMVEQPDLTDFIDITFHGDVVELRVEECTLGAGSPLIGSTIETSRIKEISGAMVVAIIGANGETTVNPGGDTRLRRDQRIVTIGSSDQLEKLRELTGHQHS